MANDKQYSLDDFAETLIRDKQYKTITPAIHDEIKKDILQRVHDYVLAKTIAKLSDEQAKSLSELLDKKPSNEEIQKFIQNSVENADDFLGDTLFQFRQTYLGLA